MTSSSWFEPLISVNIRPLLFRSLKEVNSQQLGNQRFHPEVIMGSNPLLGKRTKREEKNRIFNSFSMLIIV